MGGLRFKDSQEIEHLNTEDGESAFINWVFSVWASCCHIWALRELLNIPNFTKAMSKMI